MTWLMKNLSKIILTIIFLIFVSLFFSAGQYWLSFLTLCLILFGWRLEDIIRLVISKEGIQAEFTDTKELARIEEGIKKILMSEETNEEKNKEIQPLVDEIFRLGYSASGGELRDINNIKIIRDKDGKITGISYDEV